MKYIAYHINGDIISQHDDADALHTELMHAGYLPQEVMIVPAQVN